MGLLPDYIEVMGNDCRIYKMKRYDLDMMTIYVIEPTTEETGGL